MIHINSLFTNIISNKDDHFSAIVDKYSFKKSNGVYESIPESNTCRKHKILINVSYGHCFQIIHYEIKGSFKTNQPYGNINTYEGICDYFGIKVVDLVNIYKNNNKLSYLLFEDNVERNDKLCKKIQKINPNYEFNPIFSMGYDFMINHEQNIEKFANSVVLFAEFKNLLCANQDDYGYIFAQDVENIITNINHTNIQSLFDSYFLDKPFDQETYYFEEPISLIEFGERFHPNDPAFHKVKKLMAKHMDANIVEKNVFKSLHQFEDEFWMNYAEKPRIFHIEDLHNVYISSHEPKINYYKNIFSEIHNYWLTSTKRKYFVKGIFPHSFDSDYYYYRYFKNVRKNDVKKLLEEQLESIDFPCNFF